MYVGSRPSVISACQPSSPILSLRVSSFFCENHSNPQASSLGSSVNQSVTASPGQEVGLDTSLANQTSWEFESRGQWTKYEKWLKLVHQRISWWMSFLRPWIVGEFSVNMILPNFHFFLVSVSSPQPANKLFLIFLACVDTSQCLLLAIKTNKLNW